VVGGALKSVKRLPVVPSSPEGGFGRGRISRAEGDRGWLGLLGSCGDRGVLGRSGKAVGGVCEVSIVKVNSISFTIDDGSLMGRTCGGAEAQAEQLLGKG